MSRVSGQSALILPLIFEAGELGMINVFVKKIQQNQPNSVEILRFFDFQDDRRPHLEFF